MAWLQAWACGHSQIKLDLAVQSSVLGAVEFAAVHVLLRHRRAVVSGSGVMAVVFSVLALMILLVGGRRPPVDSYPVATVGGAPLVMVKQYV